ncbi:hypothetical protein COL01_11060 [Bacillus thuringiensis]|nr:hypothetical protein CN331_30130 [Bacillus cereus]PFV34671.1 hypothetical protein COL01_11060 [Bacillus thuringiensis]
MIDFLINFLIFTVILKTSYDAYLKLLPFLNADIPITANLIWENIRYQIFTIVFATTVAIPLTLYFHLGISGVLMFHLFCVLFQCELILLVKLADIFRKKNSHKKQISA